MADELVIGRPPRPDEPEVRTPRPRWLVPGLLVGVVAVLVCGVSSAFAVSAWHRAARSTEARVATERAAGQARQERTSALADLESAQVQVLDRGSRLEIVNLGPARSHVALVLADVVRDASGAATGWRARQVVPQEDLGSCQWRRLEVIDAAAVPAGRAGQPTSAWVLTWSDDVGSWQRIADQESDPTIPAARNAVAALTIDVSNASPATRLLAARTTVGVTGIGGCR